MNLVEDPLEPLGVAAGVFLVLAGLATVAGMPWTTAGNSVVAAGRVIGALLTVVIGAALVWLAQTRR